MHVATTSNCVYAHNLETFEGFPFKAINNWSSLRMKISLVLCMIVLTVFSVSGAQGGSQTGGKYLW